MVDTLYAHRLLLRTGLAIANVFAWVFMFEYFSQLSGSAIRGLAATALLYALSQLIIVVLTPISAMHLRRGMKHSLIWGVVFAAGAFVYLGSTLGGYFTFEDANGLGWGLIVFAILLGAYRALYWIPYKLAESEAHHAPHLHMRSFFEVFIALMPLFAGLTLVTVPAAHVHLLFGAAGLVALSALPALFLEDTRERYSWSYQYTFQQLFRSKNQGFVLQSLLEGIQGAALFLAWPIAIFITVEWSYADLGFIFTMTLLFILLLRRFYRWFLKRSGLQHSVPVYTVVSIAAWIGRLAAGTPLSIILVDTFSYTAQPERGVRADLLTFEHVGDRGAFLDEYTALKEIGLGLGRIMLAALLFFLPLFFSMMLTFAIVLLVAAAASAISIIVARRLPTAAY